MVRAALSLITLGEKQTPLFHTRLHKFSIRRSGTAAKLTRLLLALLRLQKGTAAGYGTDTGGKSYPPAGDVNAMAAGALQASTRYENYAHLKGQAGIHRMESTLGTGTENAISTPIQR